MFKSNRQRKYNNTNSSVQLSNMSRNVKRNASGRSTKVTLYMYISIPHIFI